MKTWINMNECIYEDYEVCITESFKKYSKYNSFKSPYSGWSFSFPLEFKSKLKTILDCFANLNVSLKNLLLNFWFYFFFQRYRVSIVLNFDLLSRSVMDPFDFVIIVRTSFMSDAWVLDPFMMDLKKMWIETLLLIRIRFLMGFRLDGCFFFMRTNDRSAWKFRWKYR